MAPQPSNGSKKIKSIDTTVAILEGIRERNGAGVTELANALGFSKSTVHHHLAALQKHELVVKDGTTYQIGLRFLTFGGNAQKRERIYSMGKDEVDKLSDRAGVCAQIAVEESGRGVYVYHSRRGATDSLNIQLGTRIDLHCTAVGKAILAHLPREQVDDIIDYRGLPANTPNTITSPDHLYDELDEIRSREVSFDDEEQFTGIRCVAAPVVIEDGVILGAVSLSGTIGQMNDSFFREEAPNHVQSTAGVIEANVAYSSWE